MKLSFLAEENLPAVHMSCNLCVLHCKIQRWLLSDAATTLKGCSYRAASLLHQHRGGDGVTYLLRMGRKVTSPVQFPCGMGRDAPPAHHWGIGAGFWEQGLESQILLLLLCTFVSLQDWCLGTEPFKISCNFIDNK